MSEDSDIYTVCGRCYVKISGPTQEVVNTAFRGHEKEAHGYMTGQEWYERFLKEIKRYGALKIPENGAYFKTMMHCAKRSAGLEGGDE